MRKSAIVFLSAVCFSFSTFAASKPMEINSAIKASEPMGTSTMHKLWMKPYMVELWTDARVWSMNKPFALALYYGMSFTGEQLVDRTFDEMKHVASVSDDEKTKYRPTLLQVFPSVKSGDRITALFAPPDKIVFYYNCKRTGQIQDNIFVPHFFAIWLSEKTSEPVMRKELLNLQ